MHCAPGAPPPPPPRAAAAPASAPPPEEAPPGQDYKANLNPHSLEVVQAWLEPSVQGAAPGSRYQFERLGYFCVDKDSAPGQPVFNRALTLRDTWAKIEKKKK